MVHTIRRATPHTATRLRLVYTDSTTVEIDFAPLIERGGVYAPLADPTFFAQVSIGTRGRFIAWPGGLEFCADALWRQGHGIACDDAPAAVASQGA